MAYYYRGRRYPSKPPLKTKLGGFASRVWANMQGSQFYGHREPEHYVEQAMREVQAKLSETGGTEPAQPDTPSEKE